MTTNRDSDQHDHRPQVGEFMSEWWATSNRNAGRQQLGMLGDDLSEIAGDMTPESAQYQADLERRLTRVMALPRRGEVAEKLRRRIARDRAHLFLFITDSAVPATNNVCERALRPSVIFRKVTNGFRSQWGAQTYAAFRSVVSTAKANGRAVLGDLRRALATPSHARVAAQVG